MNMLLKEINKVTLLSLLFILTIPCFSYSVTVKELETLYQNNYQQGTSLDLSSILSLYEQIATNQIEELTIWSKLAACSLLHNPTVENEQKEQIKISINQML